MSRANRLARHSGSEWIAGSRVHICAPNAGTTQPLAPGYRLAHYQIVSQLGAGGMGAGRAITAGISVPFER